MLKEASHLGTKRLYFLIVIEVLVYNLNPWNILLFTSNSEALFSFLKHGIQLLINFGASEKSAHAAVNRKI